jgi:tetratricopeptide (TPR) repeat protein
LEFLIERLRDDQRWLTEPRFAVLTWPIGITGIFLTFGQPATAAVFATVALIGTARLALFRLLPHETSRLRQGEHALAAVRPDEAIRVMRLPLALAGSHYHLKRALLLASAYVREGQFLEAHDALSRVNERRLLPDELMLLRCAWGRLFLAAGNPAEAQRRLDGLSVEYCARQPECLLLKGNVALQLRQVGAARGFLEQGLDANPSTGDRLRLLNDLALVEHTQGRTATQLERLQAARLVFREAPRADLTGILNHNLAIALVRNGQPDVAREVLREALAVGDNANPRHVLEVLNNNLLAAREAGDDAWKRAVYKEFEHQLPRFKSLSARERLALDVSRLRMHRNDGYPLKTIIYEDLIERLLNDLEQLPMATPASERIAALGEILHDLKREIETRSPSTNDVALHALAYRVTRRLLEHRVAVDAYLQALSPKLIGPVSTWRRYQTDMDKAGILLAGSQEAARVAFSRLFAHLREHAEWLTEQEASAEAITSWIIVCDEYVAYHDQLPDSARSAWRQDYLPLAEKALDRAVELLEVQPQLRDYMDRVIGVAYFNFRLRGDVAESERWVQILDEMKPSLDQYASWLRDQYVWLLDRLRAAREEAGGQ